jgi:hypothetical protein
LRTWISSHNIQFLSFEKTSSFEQIFLESGQKATNNEKKLKVEIQT